METKEINMNHTQYAGLDIGTTGIRMVELKPGPGAPELAAHGSAFTPSDLINSESSADHDKLADIIRQLKDQEGIGANEVVTAISSIHAFTTVINMPKLSKNELKKAIYLHADLYIPMPVNEAKLDWHIINPNKTNTEMSVLLVAAPRYVVEKYSSIIAKAGLKLRALEINALATARSLVSAPEVPVLVADFGNTSTEISVVWQRVPHLVRSVNVGGVTLIHSVAQNLNVGEEQAAQFLHKFGVNPSKLEGQLLKAVKGPLDAVISEISDSIKFFTGQNPGTSIEKAALTGGSTTLPEVPSYVANALNLPVEIVSPWMNVSYPASQHETLMAQSSQFAVAVGLAQRAYL